MNWIPTSSTGDDLVFFPHFFHTNGTRDPILHLYTGFLPFGEEKLVKPLAKSGAGEGVRRSGEFEEAAELRGADGSLAKAEVIEGEAENTNEDEEDVLAGGGAVGAGAGGEGGEGDGVDIAGGAQYEEGGVRAVEEKERVAESAEDSTGEAGIEGDRIHG